MRRYSKPQSAKVAKSEKCKLFRARCYKKLATISTGDKVDSVITSILYTGNVRRIKF